MRCLIQGLPFNRIPRAVRRAAIKKVNKTLNQFLTKKGVLDTLSPLTIMTGRPNPDFNDMKIEFGAYAQVYKDNEPTNTMRARITGAIALTQQVTPKVDTIFSPSRLGESFPDSSGTSCQCPTEW
jgi:hypothetical protein